MEDVAAEAAAVGTVAVWTVGCPEEVTEVRAVDGGGIPYNIVDVVTVLAVDPGRLTLDAEDTLVMVEAVAAAADEAAAGVGSSVVPEESVVICSWIMFWRFCATAKWKSVVYYTIHQSINYLRMKSMKIFFKLYCAI